MLPPCRTLLLPLALSAAALGLSACSGYDPSSAEAADSGGYGTADPGATYDTASISETVAPMLYAIDGTLELAAEEVDPSLSTLDMSWFDASAETICDGPRLLLTADQTVLEDSGVPAFGWWTLTLDASSCGPLGPDTLEVGIGAWDPQLAPPAEVAGLDGPSLYSAYLRHPGGPIFAFGVAGTAEQFNQVTPPVTEGPLPDGSYQVRPLHLLPMPE